MQIVDNIKTTLSRSFDGAKFVLAKFVWQVEDFILIT